MKPNLANALCTQCGLCCDGSLFADVELANAEGSGLEVLGLEIEEAEEGVHELLLQPCGALKGKRCSIYAHRPDCCRTFECRLLQRVRRGEISLEQAKQAVVKALGQIEAVKALIRALAGKEDDARLTLKERFAEAMAVSDFSRCSKLGQRRGELRRAMTSAENWIEKTFLTV